MFCRRCGFKIEDGDKFCRKCGWKVETNEAMGLKEYSAMSDKNNSQKDRTKIVKKTSIVAIPVIVVLMIIFFTQSVITGSAKKTALSAVQFLMDEKIDKYYKLLTPQYKEYMVGSNGWYRDEEEFKEDLLDLAQERKSEIISGCGDKVKIKYEVISIKKFEDEELSSVLWELSRDYDYDTDDIQAATEVSVSIEASGTEGTSSWTSYVACVKTHGKWYVHRPGFD